MCKLAVKYSSFKMIALEEVDSVLQSKLSEVVLQTRAGKHCSLSLPPVSPATRARSQPSGSSRATLGQRNQDLFQANLLLSAIFSPKLPKKVPFKVF